MDRRLLMPTEDKAQTADGQVMMNVNGSGTRVAEDDLDPFLFPTLDEDFRSAHYGHKKISKLRKQPFD
jgi:hypothetical protein